MSENVPTTCPRCGTAGSGNFCASCGAALGAPVCRSCSTALTPGAKFCHKCGTATGEGTADRSGQAAKFASPADAEEFRRNMAIAEASLSAAGRVLPRRDTTPWIIAGLAIVAIVTAVAWSAAKRAEPAAPNMANAGNGNGAPVGDPGAGSLGATMVAPNIDSLSPKERFLRLQNRIDQQIERKDTTRLTFFMQMAIQAYGLLSDADRDVDVRFHAAMLNAQAGMFPQARALADTIMTKAPNNLLGFVIRANVAEMAGDSAQAKTARAAFRSHYDAEMKTKRPEYVEHRPMLEQYLKGAGAN